MNECSFITHVAVEVKEEPPYYWEREQLIEDENDE